MKYELWQKEAGVLLISEDTKTANVNEYNGLTGDGYVKVLEEEIPTEDDAVLWMNAYVASKKVVDIDGIDHFA